MSAPSASSSAPAEARSLLEGGEAKGLPGVAADDQDDGLRQYHADLPASSSSSMSSMTSRVVRQRQGKPQRRGLLAAHFAFKTAATLLYLFAGIIGLGYISTFVFVVLLLSVDFWLVKNLSGRLLAGLRWWSVTDHGTGKMVWRFEAWTPEEREVAYHSQVGLFWAGMVAQQILWSVFLLAAVFSLRLGWLVIAFIGSALNGANLYGYVRCRLQQPQKESPSVLHRLSEGLSAAFRVAGGAYTRGQASSNQHEGIAGFEGGAAP